MEAEQIVETIVEESDLDEEDVKEKVEEKMEEFSGLVSEEGAVHLVAKEAGVQVAESGEQELKIENVVPEMRKVNIKARILNISDKNTFERDDDEEDGEVQNIVLGDDTGTIRLTLWDEQTEIAGKVEEGDAIGIAGAYSVEDSQGNAELRLGDSPQVKKLDDDEVPEVEQQGGGGEATKADIRAVRSENANYEVQGMLVDLYTSNPFYSRCPECGNTVREDDDGEYVCEEHAEVEPDKALAISGVLDDGTGNMRVVFFRDIGRDLLGLSEEDEREGKQKEVEKAAGEVIGKELRIEGRTRFNDYFGQLEIIANEMEELETEEQLEELLETMEA